MDITITVPSHVSAEFADEQELITLASNYLFEQAKVRVTSRAGEQAAQVGVALATAAGLKQEEAFSTIDTALGRPTPDIIESPVEEIV